MNTVVLHDYLRPSGGYSQVALEIAKTLDAPIYTIRSEFADTGLDVRQIGSGVFRRLKGFFQFYSCLKFEGLCLPKEVDTVVSSGNYSKSYIPLQHQYHVNYCHTPTRAVTDLAHARHGFFSKIPAALYRFAMGIYDQACLNRVDRWLANSKNTQTRIKKYYGRESELVYPPVDTKQFYRKKEEEYYLHVGRLHYTKRVDLVLEAFKKLGKNYRLKVVGSGPLEKKLRRQASGCSNIEFTGFLDKEKVLDIYAHAKGVVFAALNEDFGMVPVEAMASGKPVVAVAEGGALETVVSGKTGVLFEKPDASQLADAVKKCEKTSWNHTGIQKHAAAFDTSIFRKKIKQAVKRRV